MDFHPFDGSHRLVVGYYQSERVARLVQEHIQRTHYFEKVGSGFDMKIEIYDERFVEYDSGRCYIKIGKEDHEIRPSCDYLRISNDVIEAIDKWS
ncbi:MAG: hypothetical protein AAGG81_08710 [Chlamydiota bacterium]